MMMGRSWPVPVSHGTGPVKLWSEARAAAATSSAAAAATVTLRLAVTSRHGLGYYVDRLVTLPGHTVG